MYWRFMKRIVNVCYLTPNNFAHKAGDGGGHGKEISDIYIRLYKQIVVQLNVHIY